MCGSDSDAVTIRVNDSFREFEISSAILVRDISKVQI